MITSKSSSEQGPTCFIHHPDDKNSMDVVKIHGEMINEGKGCQCSTLFLILLSSILLLWSGIYLGSYSGGFRGDVFNEQQVAYGPIKSASSAPVDPNKAQVAAGKKIYTSTCSTCHLSTGLGDTGKPPLAGSEWAQGPWNRVVAIVLKGLEGPIQVKGQNFNNSMTPQESVLSDEQIAAVVTYVRQEWGNKANPVTKDQVASMKEKFKARTNAWKASELLAIPEEKEAAAPTPAPSAPAPTPAAKK